MGEHAELMVKGMGSAGEAQDELAYEVTSMPASALGRFHHDDMIAEFKVSAIPSSEPIPTWKNSRSLSQHSTRAPWEHPTAGNSQYHCGWQYRISVTCLEDFAQRITWKCRHTLPTAEDWRSGRSCARRRIIDGTNAAARLLKKQPQPPGLRLLKFAKLSQEQVLHTLKA